MPEQRCQTPLARGGRRCVLAIGHDGFHSDRGVIWDEVDLPEHVLRLLGRQGVMQVGVTRA